MYPYEARRVMHTAQSYVEKVSLTLFSSLSYIVYYLLLFIYMVFIWKTPFINAATKHVLNMKQFQQITNRHNTQTYSHSWLDLFLFICNFDYILYAKAEKTGYLHLYGLPRYKLASKQCLLSIEYADHCNTLLHTVTNKCTHTINNKHAKMKCSDV